ncbi:MAG: hypothetical protein AB1Z19_07480 [Eubacteriales bacterium]
MKLLNRKWILILALLTLTFVLSGCSQTTSIVPAAVDKDLSVVEITGTCNAEVVDDKVVVSVTTNLKSDVIFKLSVTDEAGNVLDELQMTKMSDVDPVAEFAIQDEWPDVVYGFLVASPDDNDVAGITGTYGKDFSNITYEGMVYENKKNLIVFMSDPLTIR